MWFKIGDGCVGAKDDQSTEITVPNDQLSVEQEENGYFIGAVKLVHTSGYVGCHPKYRSNWGCHASYRMNIYVTDAYNQTIYPAPRFTTADNYGFYKLPGFHYNSYQLVFSDFGNPYYLKNGDKLRIWYGEDLLDITEHDNHGSTCMKVFVYKLDPCYGLHGQKTIFKSHSYELHDIILICFHGVLV